MATKIHPVVELLAARMESYPEEFTFVTDDAFAILGRWADWIHQLLRHLNDAEKELLLGKAKDILFQRIHEEVLEELVAGPKEETMRYATANRYAQQQAMQLQQQAMQQQQQSILGSQLTTTNTLHVGGDIMLGTQRLNEGILWQIKRALGI